MKICRDLNIELCCGCHLNTVCWVSIYKNMVEFMSINCIRTMFMIAAATAKSSFSGHKSSYWFIATIREYYPEHMDMINKLVVLM